MNIKDWFWLLADSIFLWILSILLLAICIIVLPILLFILIIIIPWFLYEQIMSEKEEILINDDDLYG